MQSTAPLFGVLPVSLRLWLGAALCAALAACSDESEPCFNAPCDDVDVSYSSPDPVPCESLSESACQSSSHCVMDSVCVSARPCNGAGCSEVCELARVCVPYD